MVLVDSNNPGYTEARSSDKLHAAGENGLKMKVLRHTAVYLLLDFRYLSSKHSPVCSTLGSDTHDQ